MTDVLEAAELKADFLLVVANPHRLRVLQLLLEGEMAVGSLVRHIGLSQSALSQHLARLRESGLVKTRREAQSVFYSVSSTKVFEILETLESIFGSEATEERRLASQSHSK